MIGSTHRQTAERAGTPDGAGHSVGELVKQAAEQLSALVRQELRLAQTEMVEKGRRASRGGSMFGAAAVLGLIGLMAFAAAAVAALSFVVSIWAAALIVGGALLAVAGILALVGRTQVGRAMPPTPVQTIGSVKADVEEIRERAHR